MFLAGLYAKVYLCWRGHAVWNSYFYMVQSCFMCLNLEQCDAMTAFRPCSVKIVVTADSNIHIKIEITQCSKQLRLSLNNAFASNTVTQEQFCEVVQIRFFILNTEETLWRLLQGSSHSNFRLYIPVQQRHITTLILLSDQKLCSIVIRVYTLSKYLKLWTAF